MKIIICTRDSTFGGSGVYIKGLLKEFDKNEKIEEVLVIGPEKLKGFSKKIQFDILELKGDSFITKELIFALKCKKKIEEILKKEKYNLIYTCHPFLLNKRFPVSFITIFHGLHRAYIQAPVKNWKIKISKIFHSLYSYFDYQTIKISDKVVFVSNRALKEAEKFYPKYKNKFIHIPAFVDTLKFYPLNQIEKEKLKEKYNLQRDKKYILFVGRLEPLKGIQLLIDAIKELRRTIDIELLVAGKGILSEKVKSYDFIRYIGKIPNEKLNEIYNITDLFVLPSYYENCPLTVLEAMTSGCLVLASNVGDTREMVDNDKLIFETGNKKELKIKMIQLLNLDQGEKNRITQNLIKRAKEKYDVEIISKKILSLHSDVKQK